MRAWTLLWCCLAGSAFGSPRLSFEGTLADEEGGLLEGPVALAFSLYDQAEGGAPIWQESHPEVDVIAGDFFVTLGDVEPLGERLATDGALWLEVAVDGGPALTPRNPLTEVPRAAAALWAADVTGQHIHPAEVSVGDRLVIDRGGRWVGPGGPGGGAPDYRLRFIDIDAETQNFCGLLANGRALCFGRAYLQAPATPFTAIAVGESHACGLKADGTVGCFGAGPEARTMAPDGRFTQIVAGMGHTCALAEGGEVACWGDDLQGQSTPPNDRFVSLCAGGLRSCGVLAEGGAIRCWGGDGQGRPNPAPPAGDGYAGVTCGFQLVCGWRADGFASCSGVAGAPPGLYARIEAGSSHACGFDPAGSLTCWPDVVSSAAALGGPGLVDVAAGDFSTCGIRTDGTVTCWGVRDGFTPRPPEGFAPFGENP